MYRLQDASPSKAPLGDRLCAIIKKELGMDAFPKDPFAWISYKDGNKLVEVLKGNPPRRSFPRPAGGGRPHRL